MPGNQEIKATVLDDTFYVGVIFKGIGGFIELLAGLLLLFISVQTFQHWLAPLAKIGIHAGSEITSGTKLFVVAYFGVRGLIRMLLALSLLREQLWAYPASIALLGASVAYQIFLLATGHYSSGLLALTLFDVLIIALTAYEYRKLKAGGHLKRPHL